MPGNRVAKPGRAALFPAALAPVTNNSMLSPGSPLPNGLALQQLLSDVSRLVPARSVPAIRRCDREPIIVNPMARFTSTRERRLWGWTLAVLVAVYSTVGLAGTLAQALRDEVLLGVSFGAALLIVIAAVVGIARSLSAWRPCTG